jgi:hypothetical protein
MQLAQGEQLTVVFALPGFNSGNPPGLLPTTISLELAGFAPPGSAIAPIPGSTQNYYSGILLQGSLQSTDGTISVPLFDADSWRLGLPTGDLVADAGFGGGASVYADVIVSLNTSEAIFGTSGQAEFTIKNLGAAFTIGLGPGYSLSNAILAPLSSDNGAVQTAGYLMSTETFGSAVHSAQTPVPEPAAIGIAAVGGTLLYWLRKRIRPRRS